MLLTKCNTLNYYVNIARNLLSICKAFAFCKCWTLRWGNFLVSARKSPKKPTGGSDATAASGGKRELSEWQRSARSEPASTGEVSAGYRNRTNREMQLDKKKSFIRWEKSGKNGPVYRTFKCKSQQYQHFFGFERWEKSGSFFVFRWGMM